VAKISLAKAEVDAIRQGDNEFAYLKDCNYSPR
jgi:hypothetical protein